MYPFEYPHNCYNPRNCNVMPNRKEDDQPPSPHFNYPPYPSNYPHPSYYHYGPPHLPYVQPPPAPLPPCYYPHYYPPHPTYFIPPPSPCNYPMDHHHPGYDDHYNYHSSRTHCCGCANHTCQPRNNASSSLTIQEEPFHQSERRESNDAVPPSNYTPPIVWRLPSSDSVKATNSDNKYNEKALEKDDVGKTGSQSPSYPVIWLPRNNGFEEMARDKNATASKSAQEWPSNLKFVPMKFLENGSSDESKSEVHQVAPPMDKKSSVRNIPVKDRSSLMSDKGEDNVDKLVEEVERNQLSNVKNVPLIFFENGENNRLKKDIQQEVHDPVEKKEIKMKTIPVKHVDEKSSNMSTDKNKKEDKLDGKEESKTNNTSEKKKLSTTKSSKLPPVCLRVDPRPRKTSSNGSSTSKSTTAATTGTTTTKTNKESNCGNEKPSHEKRVPNNIVKECNQSEPVIPINIVRADNLSQDEKEQVCEENMTVASPEKKASADDSSKASEVISGGNNIENREKSGMENLAKTTELEMNLDEEKVLEPTKKIDEKSSGKRVLSETDAATIIQSAYRGFEVRRWHPLEKLKKIAKVRKETDNVRRQIDDIEACPSHQLDAKKKVVLGETIMNLLLQLDMIQGLHPSVKEVRKRIANELTSLEDKLDSICSRIAKEHDSSRLDTTGVESSKCEGNIVCSAPETLKLESTKPDSMDDKITTTPDAELETSEDGAANVTSSTLVCEAASEHEVQVDDNGTKNNETVKEEKPPSFKERIDEEEISEEVKHQCFEREIANMSYNMDSTVSIPSLSPKPLVPASEEDMNSSNVLSHQAEDEHVASKQDKVSDQEEKGNLMEDKETMSVAELHTRSDDNGIKSHEIIQEEKSFSAEERVDEKQISDMDSVSTPSSSSKPFEPASVEDTNPSNVLVHQAEDEHVKQDNVGDLEEEKDNSAENKETSSVVERRADYAESNIASDELPKVDIDFDDALEERSSAFKSDGDSIVIGNESENAADAGMLEDPVEVVMVDEDKQMISEGFEASEAATEDADITSGRKMGDDSDKNDEIYSENEVCVSNKGAADAVSNVRVCREGDAMKKEEVQLIEENEKLRKMIEELVRSGNKQLDVITNLNGRVKDLEKKLQLTKKKRMKLRRNKAVKNHSNEVGGN